MFIHKREIVIPDYQLEQVNLGEGNRIYKRGDKSYKSVTTFLKQFDDGGLDVWRARVGEEKANRIAKAASARGTGLHSIAERFLLNDPDYMQASDNYTSINLFRQLQPTLEDNITGIYGTETRLYSDILGLAGTADLICDWCGRPSIGDFKTSIKPKKIEWIDKYFLQCAAYSVMVEELLGLQCKQLVVMIAIEQDPEPQLFIENRIDWVKKLVNLVKTTRK